jgi:hypothetical protein
MRNLNTNMQGLGSLERSIVAYLTSTFGFVTIKKLQTDIGRLGNNGQHKVEIALRKLLVNGYITRLNLGPSVWVYGTD